MMPEQQQRILGYFIEEAKDHLNTIEQGLLNLQATIEDPEMVNELFRAAHSVKGGAAMLSLNSIQRTSHRLEDYFKVLKETAHIPIDRPLESMLLQVFDGLQSLLEELQGPFGLTEEKSQEVMTDLEPVFEQLEQHLNTLAAQAGSSEAIATPKAAPSVAVARSPQKSTPSREDSALKLVFRSDVPGHLREMLSLFKQADTPSSRSALEEICQALYRIGEQFDLSGWCDITTAARQAVGNRDQTYRFLAPVVIKELKKAQEQVLAGRASEIQVSADLAALLPALPEADVGMDEIDAFLDEAFAGSDQEELDLVDLFAAETTSVSEAMGEELDPLPTPSEPVSTPSLEASGLPEVVADLSTPENAAPREPLVGAAELNSLADLFEGEISGLGSPWDEITESEAAIADSIKSDTDFSDDFADLLGETTAETPASDSETDLADLFGVATLEAETDSATQEFDDLFTATDSLDNEESVATAEVDTLLNSIEEPPADIDQIDAASGDLEDLLTTDTLGQAALAEEGFPSDDVSTNLDLELEATASGFLDLEADLGAEPSGDSLANVQALETGLDLGFEELAESEGTVNLPDTTATASTDAAGFAVEAIEDPWSSDDEAIEVSEAAALDALDELWSEGHPDEAEMDDIALSPETSDVFSDFDNLALEEADLALGELVAKEPEVTAVEASLATEAALEESADSGSDIADSLLATDDLPTPEEVDKGLMDALFTSGDSPAAEAADDLGAIAENDFDLLFDTEFDTEDDLASDVDFPSDSGLGGPAAAIVDPFTETDQDLGDLDWSEGFTSPAATNQDLDLLGEVAGWTPEPAAESVPTPDDLFEDTATALRPQDAELSLDLLDTPDTFIQRDDEVADPQAFFDPETEGDRPTATPLEGTEAADDFFAMAPLPAQSATVTDDLFDLDDGPVAAPTDAIGAVDDFFEAPVANGGMATEDSSEMSTDLPLDLEVAGLELETTGVATGDLDLFDEESATTGEDLLNLEVEAEGQSDEDLSAVDTFMDTSDASDTVLDGLETDDNLSFTATEPDTGPDLELDLDLESSLGSDLEAVGDAAADTDSETEPGLTGDGWDETDLSTRDLQGMEDLNPSASGMDGSDDQLSMAAIAPHQAIADTPEPSEEDSLDDLNVLLAEEEGTEAAAIEAPSPETDGVAFDDLEALLEGDAEPEVAIAADTAQADDDFDDLEALLDDAPIGQPDRSQSTRATDDFGDLEKLLEEADQTLGGSSPSRGAGGGRTNRRMGGMVDQTMRVSVKHLDNLNNLVGELVVNRNSLEQDQERLRQFLDNLLFQVQQLNDVGQRMRDLYERSLLESSLLASRQAFHSGGLTRSDHLGSNGGSHATGATFDALEMDRFTGFHTLTQEMIELIVRVRESASDIAYTVESTDQIARQFRQVTTQLQEGLNKARMVPFAQTADRLPRAVRDISIKCGKEARLVVEGRDTLIDKMILERLYDPMTHLVNNAITHGIETPEERAAMGKPREGTITVRAFYQGNQTVIYIADDGAGINPDVVKRKAIQKGLITQAEADAMTTLETYELLFRHGFSTRDKADDFAGRGVGMDVVQTALAEIRGSITIDSELGKGTSFTIRLPLTLSISKALSCLNNQARIAFPMDGVEDMFDVPKERIQVDANNHTCIQWRDTLLTFQPLSELLQFNRLMGRGRVYGGNQDEDMISIVVLRNANTFIGVQVDRVLGEQEIVIKQIEGPVPKPMGIAGATVLGDGRVMPIGDVMELIDIAQGRVRRESGSSLWSQVELPPEVPTSAVKTEPTVLIVDDSITVRELLSMSFNKVGYRVEQARDGQEAWEKLRSGLPCDLVFCDIEMPRMDGLELLSRMQKDSTLKRIPIAMLTSRGADRHRQMAVDLGASGYFTKPYLEEALLDAAQRMLKGEVLLTREEVQADMEA